MELSPSPRASRSSLSRREFLTAVLGASAAAQACRRRPRPLPFGGRLLGQSDVLGHRLLSAGPPAPATPERVGVLIAGGGIAGLSAAWRLMRAGFDDFALVDVEPLLGGTSASGKGFPWGAHYVPTPDPSNRSLVELLKELGAVESEGPEGIRWNEAMLCRAPQERLFYKGLWSEGLYLAAGATRKDLDQLEAFHRLMADFAGRRDKEGRRAFNLPISAGAVDPETRALDRISMAQFMAERGFDSPRLRWLVDYGTRDDYGITLDQISAWVGVFYFAARIAGAGYRSSEYLTWPEGNGRLVDHVAKLMGPRARTGILVTDLEPGASSVEVRGVDAEGRPHAWVADHAVCAMPIFAAKRVVGPWRRSPPDFVSAFRYSPWVIANVHLSGRPESRGFPMAWDNVLYESQALGYVVSTHQTGVDRGPTVWTWYWALCHGDPSVSRQELLDAPWSRWADAVMADLERAHVGLRELVERIDVWRWGHAMVRPEAGFVLGGAPEKARAPLGRLRFAHTDLSGLALVEEAHDHGVRVAEEILRERGVAVSSFR